MLYYAIHKGRFLKRPNRFIAQVEIDGKEETCHVKNTGRCKELLRPGVTVYCEKSANPKRKTHYDLIAVEKIDPAALIPGQQPADDPFSDAAETANSRPFLINMDSQAPNKVIQEWLEAGGLFPNLTYLKPECRHENSRFDFYLEWAEPVRLRKTPPRLHRVFLEVKGVTLEEQGVVLFPDAPTERGVKHLQELTRCLRQGYESYVIFVVQMSAAKYFRPNDLTHLQFGTALREAVTAGVKALAYTCKVTPDSLILDQPLPLKL